MKPSEIKALFPIIVTITKEMIDNAIYGDRNNCIACKALKSILPEQLHNLIDWGTGIGRVDGIPIRSMTKIDKEYTIHYLQHSNTKENTIIKFIIDNR